VDIISEIFLFILIVGSFIVGILNIIDAFKNSYKRRISDAPWSKFGYAILGFYWCVVYSLIAFYPLLDKNVFKSDYVDPSIVFLIVLLLMGKQKSVYLPDIIKNSMKKLKEKRGRILHGKH
jgi:uncharacterized membrane protein